MKDRLQRCSCRAIPTTTAVVWRKDLREAKAQLDRQAQEKAALQEAKIEARRQEEEATGEKKRGRKLKEPNEKPEPKKAKVNLTDLDSRIMKTRHGYV